MLTANRLRGILLYCPSTGKWYWRISRNRIKIGDRAGRLKRTGYWVVGIDGKVYRSARLAWLYMTGSWPINVIDHINRVANDDRFENLRDVTTEENNRNREDGGGDGVYFRQDRKQWRARVRAGKKRRISLGCFLSEEAALAAVAAYKRS